MPGHHDDLAGREARLREGNAVEKGRRAVDGEVRLSHEPQVDAVEHGHHQDAGEQRVDAEAQVHEGRAASRQEPGGHRHQDGEPARRTAGEQTQPPSGNAPSLVRSGKFSVRKGSMMPSTMKEDEALRQRDGHERDEIGKYRGNRVHVRLQLASSMRSVFMPK